MFLDLVHRVRSENSFEALLFHVMLTGLGARTVDTFFFTTSEMYSESLYFGTRPTLQKDKTHKLIGHVSTNGKKESGGDM